MKNNFDATKKQSNEDLHNIPAYRQKLSNEFFKDKDKDLTAKILSQYCTVPENEKDVKTWKDQHYKTMVYLIKARPGSTKLSPEEAVKRLKGLTSVQLQALRDCQQQDLEPEHFQEWQPTESLGAHKTEFTHDHALALRAYLKAFNASKKNREVYINAMKIISQFTSEGAKAYHLKIEKDPNEIIAWQQYVLATGASLTSRYSRLTKEQKETLQKNLNLKSSDLKNQGEVQRLNTEPAPVILAKPETKISEEVPDPNQEAKQQAVFKSETVEPELAQKKTKNEEENRIKNSAATEQSEGNSNTEVLGLTPYQTKVFDEYHIDKQVLTAYCNLPKNEQVEREWALAHFGAMEVLARRGKFSPEEAVKQLNGLNRWQLQAVEEFYSQGLLPEHLKEWQQAEIHENHKNHKDNVVDEYYRDANYEFGENHYKALRKALQIQKSGINAVKTISLLTSVGAKLYLEDKKQGLTPDEILNDQYLDIQDPFTLKGDPLESPYSRLNSIQKEALRQNPKLESSHLKDWSEEIKGLNDEQIKLLKDYYVLGLRGKDFRQWKADAPWGAFRRTIVDELVNKYKLTPAQAIEELSELSARQVSTLIRYYSQGLRGEHLKVWKVEASWGSFHQKILDELVNKYKFTPAQAMEEISRLSDEQLNTLIKYYPQGLRGEHLRAWQTSTNKIWNLNENEKNEIWEIQASQRTQQEKSWGKDQQEALDWLVEKLELSPAEALKRAAGLISPLDLDKQQTLGLFRENGLTIQHLVVWERLTGKRWKNNNESYLSLLDSLVTQKESPIQAIASFVSSTRELDKKLPEQPNDNQTIFEDSEDIFGNEVTVESAEKNDSFSSEITTDSNISTEIDNFLEAQKAAQKVREAEKNEEEEIVNPDAVSIKATDNSKNAEPLLSKNKVEESKLKVSNKFLTEEDLFGPERNSIDSNSAATTNQNPSVQDLFPENEDLFSDIKNEEKVSENSLPQNNDTQAIVQEIEDIFEDSFIFRNEELENTVVEEKADTQKDTLKEEAKVTEEEAEVTNEEAPRASDPVESTEQQSVSGEEESKDNSLQNKSEEEPIQPKSNAVTNQEEEALPSVSETTNTNKMTDVQADVPVENNSDTKKTLNRSSSAPAKSNGWFSWIEPRPPQKGKENKNTIKEPEKEKKAFPPQKQKSWLPAFFSKKETASPTAKRENISDQTKSSATSREGSMVVPTNIPEDQKEILEAMKNLVAIYDNKDLEEGELKILLKSKIRQYETETAKKFSDLEGFFQKDIAEILGLEISENNTSSPQPGF